MTHSQQKKDVERGNDEEREGFQHPYFHFLALEL